MNFPFLKTLKVWRQNLQANKPLGWSQLSHQKTRLFVAITGVTFSNILIFTQLGLRALLFDGDEPTSALDSKTGRDVVEIMRRLAKEEGCAVLSVTHDNRILDIADRILHMEDGQIAR